MTYSAKEARILIVDDSPSHIQYLGNILKESGYSVAYAQNGEQAIKKVQSYDFDLILLDVIMPDMDGFEVCIWLKNYEKTKDIPVIFLTADYEHSVRGFEVGGVDYVTKPFHSAELQARVRTHLHLVKMQKELKQTNLILSQTVQERTQKLQKAIEELDVFFYRAAHDLRGPLASLHGLNYLFEHEVTDPKALEYQSMIKKTLLKLIELNDSILNVGKIRAHQTQIQSIIFRPFLLNIIDKLAFLARFTETEFEFNFKEDTVLNSDPFLLDMALKNIIQNAIQYHAPYVKPYVLIHVRQQQGYDSIQITDNGIGIEKNTIPKLFKMFFKACENSTGFGLGLYKAGLAIEALQGKIFCESQPGKGSVFSIVLPAVL